MSTSRNLYEILDVDNSASKDELKKSYRKLAMKYHPDRNSGNKDAETKFKEINYAYDILKDDKKKEMYDRFGHTAFENNGNNYQNSNNNNFGNFSNIFDEVFGEFMGNTSANQKNTNKKGIDLKYDLKITLEDAFRSTQKIITISTLAKCNTCNGMGSKKGSSIKTCNHCNGIGKIHSQQGFFTIEKTCPQCQGMGEIIKNPCSNCNGTGRKNKNRNLKVSIPKGVEEGTRIRLSGEGESGIRNGTPGDLYVFLTIKNHKFFTRKNEDLNCTVPIPMIQAALGGYIEVPTIDGFPVKVSLPKGTQNGKILRLKDKGMPIMHRLSRGALYVKINVETPINLSQKQKEILEQFNNASPSRGNNPSSSSFLGKLKDFLAGT